MRKQALIWGTALLLVQLSLLTPLLAITFWFAAIPAVVLYVKTNRYWFAGTAGVSLAACATLSGSFALGFLWIALTTLVPAIALGEAYRRRQTARKSVTAGIIAYLAMFLLSVLVATGLGVNLTTAIGAMIRDGLAAFPEPMRSALTDETLHEFILWTVRMIPFYFIATSALMAALTHTLARRLANRRGPALVPSMPPIRDWKLPRTFVWYYLAALFVDLLVPADDTSFMTTVIVNIVPLFMFVFAVQGISFLFYIGYTKRKMWIPWIGVAAVVLVNPLFSAFSLLGVFDTAFPIRDRFRKT